MLRFTELLNKVWGLEGCPLKGQTMRTNRSVRFGFGGATVQVGRSGDPVSCYTTVGDGGCCLCDRPVTGRSTNKGGI